MLGYQKAHVALGLGDTECLSEETHNADVALSGNFVGSQT